MGHGVALMGRVLRIMYIHPEMNAICLLSCSAVSMAVVVLELSLHFNENYPVLCSSHYALFAINLLQQKIEMAFIVGHQDFTLVDLKVTLHRLRRRTAIQSTRWLFDNIEIEKIYIFIENIFWNVLVYVCKSFHFHHFVEIEISKSNHVY